VTQFDSVVARLNLGQIDRLDCIWGVKLRKRLRPREENEEEKEKERKGRKGKQTN
jgi:hypothetical protein